MFTPNSKAKEIVQNNDIVNKPKNKAKGQGDPDF